MARMSLVVVVVTLLFSSGCALSRQCSERRMSTHSSQLNLDPHCPVHAERVRTDSQGSLLSDRTRRMLAEAIVHSIVQIGVNELLEKNRDRSKDETEILIRSSSALLVDRLLDRMYR